MIQMHSLWITLLAVNIAVNVMARGISGPYKVILRSTHRCPRIQFAMEKVPTIRVTMQAYNNTKNVTLLRGNINILKDTSKLKAKAKQFLWVNGKWKLNLIMHHGSCDGIFVSVAVTYLGGKLDTRRCSLALGNLSFKDLDVNKISHMWAPIMDYGKQLWKIEIYGPSGVAACWEFLEEIVPD